MDNWKLFCITGDSVTRINFRADKVDITSDAVMVYEETEHGVSFIGCFYSKNIIGVFKTKDIGSEEIKG